MSLPEALAWKYGPVADTAGDEITGWRSPLPKPNQAQIDALLIAYTNRDRKPERDKRIDRIASEEMALLIEAIEDNIGIPRGKLIADAKAKAV